MATCHSTQRSLIHCRHCGRAHHVNRLRDISTQYELNPDIVWAAFQSWGCTALEPSGYKPCSRDPVVSEQMLDAIRRRYRDCGR